MGGKRLTTLTTEDETFILTLDKNQLCLLEWLQDHELLYECSYTIQNNIIDPSSEVDIDEKI